jgi:hypothetical protein
MVRNLLNVALPLRSNLLRLLCDYLGAIIVVSITSINFRLVFVQCVKALSIRIFLLKVHSCLFSVDNKAFVEYQNFYCAWYKLFISPSMHKFIELSCCMLCKNCLHYWKHLFALPAVVTDGFHFHAVHSKTSLLTCKTIQPSSFNCKLISILPNSAIRSV